MTLSAATTTTTLTPGVTIAVASTLARAEGSEKAVQTDKKEGFSEANSKRSWLQEHGQLLSSSLTSTLVHMVLLLILALWFHETPRGKPVQMLTLNLDTSHTENVLGSLAIDSLEPEAQTEIIVGPPVIPQQPISSALPLDERYDTPLIQLEGTPSTSVTSKSAPIPGHVPVIGGLNGKDRRDRRGKALEAGATLGSEDAVEQALRWISRHQRKDGSWRFDHHDGACDGSCRNPGNHASTTASTALALLCFYGAGYTHVEGDYADTVNRGLYYLGGRMLLTQEGGDLQEGTMYAQGIAAIALCEAAAMTDDPTLRGYGERAIQFILYAQDKKGGGWRYMPGEPGDTTVTGWQLMALKSAQMSGIPVPSPAFEGANRFLDSVQSRNGALYGYQNTLQRDSTTAVGLLSRMYLGWKHDHVPLHEGIHYLDKLGPSKNDLYYNYYATQVMRHYGGEPWKRWNVKMREYLISTQARNGHETGSWFFPEKHNDQGGRLLNTCLATMTLEVYYRHQPLYQKNAANSGY
jgi:hypothetical protein